MDEVRLIDAKALERNILGWDKETYRKAQHEAYENALNEIFDSPTIDPESLRPVSEWELNPNKWTCEWFRCKKCRHISCCTDAYCGGCGAKMKNSGAKSEDLPEPQEERGESGNEWKEVH